MENICIMENNFIQMTPSADHIVAYTIGSIFKHIIDCVQLYFNNAYLLNWPSVRIIDLVSYNTYVVCVLILYIGGATYCLKSFGETFYGSFIYFQSFC